MKINEPVDEQLSKLNKQLTIVEKNRLREQLMFYINDLLLHDFKKLVQILYRIDVSEQKLKTLLQQNPQTDASEIIVDLLIQRQEEKIKSKDSHKSNRDISEEDKW
jgi:hypothetical protein